MSWHLAQTTETKALGYVTLQAISESINRTQDRNTRGNRALDWNTPYTSPIADTVLKVRIGFFFSARIANQMNF